MQCLGCLRDVETVLVDFRDGSELVEFHINAAWRCFAIAPYALLLLKYQIIFFPRIINLL